MRTAVFLILAALTGCGYHQGIRPGAAPSQSIAIPIFENLTFEPLLDQRVHEIFKETFVARGWRVVDLDRASTVLSGKISLFDRTPISLNLLSQAEEYRVKIGLALALGAKESAASKLDVEGSAEYTARLDPAEDRAAEDRAIREAARRLAERAADLLSERVSSSPIERPEAERPIERPEAERPIEPTKR